MELILLIVTAGLLASYLTMPSQRSRQFVFLLICVIGASIGIYGFLIAARAERLTSSYFRMLGLPLSLIIALVLCFGVIMLDKTFTASQLTKWIYPMLCWYFAGWVVLNTGVLIWRSVKIGIGIGTYRGVALFGPIFEISTGKYAFFPIWTLISALSVLAAFMSAGLWKLQLRTFQVFLPAIFIMFLFTIWVEYQMMIVFSELSNVAKLSESVERELRVWQASRAEYLIGNFFERHLWALFMIIVYLYLNAKKNAKQLPQFALLSKLPKTAVLLVVASFLHEFPEYNRFQSLFPLGSRMVEYGLITLDISIVPGFLLLYWWPHMGR